ncbi:MAG: sigma-70 family RNA polymerase sigma factor [Planctomycetaceae bacterium]
MSEPAVNWEDHKGLASRGLRIAKWMEGCDKVEDTEAYSHAMLALFEAAKTYDPEKSSFSTWASRQVYWRLKSKNTLSMQQKLRHENFEQRETDAFGGDGDPRSMATVGVVEPEEDLSSELLMLRREIRCLPFLEREALELHLDGMNQRQAAEFIGVGVGTYGDRLERAIDTVAIALLRARAAGTV